MAYTYAALALAWLVVLGLVALSASGMVAGAWVLLLVGAALVMPSLILTLSVRFSNSTSREKSVS